MIINNNIPALNTYRQMGINQGNMQSAMEKLSSGLRINRAGDDAAGLAISEKMRAQIRGLDQASRNAQDGISMIQTAEGALNESHNILQRMRELATQASNDTNVEVDREEIQKEINELTSELNRIGNTTEFNTQKILQGTESGEEIQSALNLDPSELITGGELTGGQTNDPTHASLDIQFEALAAGRDGSEIVLNFGGEEFTLNFSDTNGATGNTGVVGVTANEATIEFDGSTASAEATADLINEALTAMIAENNNLTDEDFTIDQNTETITISANEDGQFAAGAGSIVATTDDAGLWDGADTTLSDFGSNTTYDYASENVAFGAIADDNALLDLVGTGITINGQSIEFYNADDGPYDGEADFAVNISSVIGEANHNEALVEQIAAQLGNKLEGVTLAQDGNTASELVITATEGGEAGNNITFADGVSREATLSESFAASFQIGANQGQSMTINIDDMRANALGVSGTEAGSEVEGVENAAFTAIANVTDGTDNEAVEYALDVSTHERAAAAITVINDAIEQVSAQRSNLGAFQNRLEHTIANLDNSSENLSAAESRIRDVDMAREMMEMTRANILSQASQSMLAQANQAPQSVLQLLG